MEKLGLPYQTIAYGGHYMKENKYIYYLKKIMMADWHLYMGRKKIERQKRLHPKFKANVDVREACFDAFAQSMFHLSKLCKSRAELEEMANDYSAVLVGSDQMWKPASVEKGYCTLDWVPDNIRKIAYSTSIGVKKMPWFQTKKCRWFMNRFHTIAMREQSACDIVYEMTGRKVPVVLDPTLLFTGEEWMNIQQAEPLTQGKYIFCYLLGNNPPQREIIKEISRITGCKIVALQHLDEYVASDEGFADEAPYNVGPKEFLNYIRNAEYVLTDSFHGSVFSILYKKNFFTFSRFSETAKQGTNTRIDNLLNITGLQGRRVSNTDKAEEIVKREVSFDGVDERLNQLREFSMNYLKSAFEGLS